MTATKTRKHYSVVERDGALTLVRSLTDGAEVFVDFDARRKRWVCSECPGVCDHVTAATVRLPLEVATEIAAIVAAPRKPDSLSTKTGGARIGEPANLAALAAAMEKSAEIRAERNRRHDEQHEHVTREVTVRKACKDDLERLRLARERKARTYQVPIGLP